MYYNVCRCSQHFTKFAFQLEFQERMNRHQELSRNKAECLCSVFLSLGEAEACGCLLVSSPVPFFLPESKGSCSVMSPQMMIMLGAICAIIVVVIVSKYP